MRTEKRKKIDEFFNNLKSRYLPPLIFVESTKKQGVYIEYSTKKEYTENEIVLIEVKNRTKIKISLDRTIKQTDKKRDDEE